MTYLVGADGAAQPAGERFRALLARDEILRLPGAHNGLAGLGPADFEQSGWAPRGVFDGDQATGWAIMPAFGKPHTLLFETHSPVGYGSGELFLSFRLSFQYGRQHTLGRFKLYATTENAALLRPITNERLVPSSRSTALIPLLGLTAAEASVLALPRADETVRDVVTRATQTGTAMADALRAVFIGLCSGALVADGWAAAGAA